MKIIFTIFSLLISTSAFAFQTPMQQSAAATKAVVDVILKSNASTFLSISKIKIDSTGAKVELLDQNGHCSAIPVSITADALGTPQAEIMIDSLAICD